MREMANPTAACAELVQSSIRPQFEILLGILRELLPPTSRREQLRLTAFSIVGQCLFYHFADPVIRNLLGRRRVRPTATSRNWPTTSAIFRWRQSERTARPIGAGATR